MSNLDLFQMRRAPWRKHGEINRGGYGSENRESTDLNTYTQMSLMKTWFCAEIVARLEDNVMLLKVETAMQPKNMATTLLLSTFGSKR